MPWPQTTTAAARTRPLGEWLVSTLAEGWGAAPPVPHPAEAGTAQAAFRHRAQLEARFPDAALVVPAGSVVLDLPRRTGPGSVEYPADRRVGAAWVGGVPGGWRRRSGWSCSCARARLEPERYLRTELVQATA